MTVHRECRRPVRARFDTERERQEGGDPPLPERGGNHGADTGDDGQDDAARDDRADERSVGEPAATGGAPGS